MLERREDLGTTDTKRELQDHPVISLLRKRLKETWQGNTRHVDGSTLALAVEGGGMRGAVSAGMLLALEQLGAVSAFDVIYGASAGAMNICFFVTGQGPLGATVYYNGINNRDFINFWRLAGSKPVVDLDYLLQDVLVNRIPLHWDRVINSNPPIRIIATNIDRLDSEVLKDFDSPYALRKALKASATIPLLGGPPVEIEDTGNRYLDASLKESLPFESAIDEGASHILVLSSRPASEGRRSSGYLTTEIFKRYLESLKPGLGKLFEDRSSKYMSEMKKIDELSEDWDNEPHIYRVNIPEDGNSVSKLEKDRRVIMEGMKEGANTMMKELEYGDFSPTEVLKFHDSNGMELQSTLEKTDWLEGN